MRWARIVMASALAFILCSASAYSEGQEANVLLGGAITDRGSASWAFQVEYKQLDLLRCRDFIFDGSFSYLNEGHPTGHARDGITAQGWIRILDGSKLRVSLGAGPYLYNDRVTGASPAINGLGLAASLDVKYETDGLRFGPRLSEILVPAGPNATSLLWEVGFDLPDKVSPEAEPKNEISFLPATLANNGRFFELRYARTIVDHLEVMPVYVAGSWFKAKGFAPETCATNEFGNFKIGVCTGPYYDYEEGKIVDIASLHGEYSFRNTPWSFVINFDRTSNRDGGGRGLDNTSFGMGYRF